MKKNTISLKLSAFLCFFFLFSCLENNNVISPNPNNENPNNSNADAGRELILKNLYEDIKVEYYWYDQLKEISYSDSKYYDKNLFPYNASAANEYFNDVKYSEDKWSYVGPIRIYSSSGNGALYGFRYNTEEEEKEEDNLTLRIVYVNPGSPIDRAGMKRGDRITSFKVNGSTKATYYKEVIDTTLTNNLALYQEEIFYSTSGTFTLEGPNGEKTISSSREKLEPHYLLNINQEDEEKIDKRFAPTLISLANSQKNLTKNIGYAIYTEFDEESVVDLLNMFYFWKQNNVKDVIFDLRYNGGGRVDVTRFITSMLINNFGKDFVKLDFREVSYYKDEIQLIEKIDSAFLSENFDISTKDYPASNIVNLSIKSAYFLVTEDSASASELLIKALEPYVKVIVVGENTRGKGYGQIPKTNLARGYYQSIINFRYFNADDEGVEFTGIPPTPGFEGEDDINQNWGTGENLFDLAINDLQAKLEEEQVIRSGYSPSAFNSKIDNTYYSFSINAPKEKIEIPYERNWQ